MNDSPDGARILVVEDDALVADMVCHELDYAGYNVAGTCASVATTLQALDSGVFAAVVLDITLPDGKSYPLADRLACDGIPFLFYSSHGLNELPVEYQGFPYVAKMAPISALLRTLDAIL